MYQAIKPGDADYTEVKSAVESAEANSGIFDYNGLTTFLNSLPSQSIVPTKLRKTRKAALVAQLEKRGLAHQVDVVVTPVNDAEEGESPDEILVITKLTDKAGEIIQHARRGRPPRSEGAAAGSPQE